MLKLLIWQARDENAIPKTENPIISDFAEVFTKVTTTDS